MLTKKAIRFFILALVLLLIFLSVKWENTTTETMHWKSLRIKFDAITGLIFVVLLITIVYYIRKKG